MSQHMDKQNIMTYYYCLNGSCMCELTLVLITAGDSKTSQIPESQQLLEVKSGAE